MKTKVTLSFDADFVFEAKEYARKKNKSLSRVITESLKLQIETESSLKRHPKNLRSLNSTHLHSASSRAYVCRSDASAL